MELHISVDTVLQNYIEKISFCGAISRDSFVKRGEELKCIKITLQF